MALNQSIPTDFGVAATYWHILALQVNRVQQTMQVTMAGYIDAAARQAGFRPVAVTTVSLEAFDYPGDGAGIRYDAIYERLKRPSVPDGGGSEPPFANSTDV
ncbi:hypothetical protein EI613_32205 (plasmid) [Azospirillum sp. 412522]|nr:hypothetical protein [Azospirillum sp. 412522]MBY6266516.1 hypothetical protein [Azospirillum sp. 412522]